MTQSDPLDQDALADSIFEGLNPAQRKAVETTEGPLLVLAGAGSGKTRVLTARIAYLIGVLGIPAEQILAVTFTNKAAGEMKERVEKLLGPAASEVSIGTFHSIGVRILRRDIGHLARNRGFVIYDDADSIGVIKDVLKGEGLDPKVHEPRRIRWQIDQWKNAGLLPPAAADRARDLDEELIASLYAKYQRKLADAEALDFGDLLLLTVELFRKHPRVLDYYRNRYNYILVDEYQDTNGVQYGLIGQLAQVHRNLCVVGDPDQSIYAWRGADIRNILDFEQDYADSETAVKVIKLEQNYRSTQPILSGASAVISNNFDRKDKDLFTDREGGSPIRFFEAEDDREESRFVIDKLLNANRREDVPFRHVAILYRTNAQSRSFEEELLKYDVPYTIVGGQRFYDRAEIKDIMCYLRLLVNPRDDQAIRRIVNKPTRGIGKASFEKVESLAAGRGVPLMEAMRIAVETKLVGRSTGKLAAFLDMMDGFSSSPAGGLAVGGSLDGLALDDMIARVMDGTGYIRALEKEDTPDSEARLDNLRELLSSARDFHVVNEEELEGEERSELELYLDQVALISDLDSYEDREDRVSLMTVHSAKGLEFPIVFLVGMEERIFPHASSIRDETGLEEERRLCYVAMTRAMEHLFLTCAAERFRYGDRTYQSPSRFLQEIPDELIETLGSASRSARSRVSSAGGSSSRFDYSYAQGEASEGIALGTRVRHPVFGRGEVLAVLGSDLNQKLRIKFERAGVKTVMVRYANLELA
ncbi:MAG: ATP-dependent DNA helicase PcrA [Deltaproteobacteria bacterium]|nr:ATP-dependent DNA helicase PcrA [Deltaproteobacteria bacterium]